MTLLYCVPMFDCSGFVWGLLMAGVNSHGAYWGSTDDWPTPEMKNRFDFIVHLNA